MYRRELYTSIIMRNIRESSSSSVSDVTEPATSSTTKPATKIVEAPGADQIASVCIASVYTILKTSTSKLTKADQAAIKLEMDTLLEIIFQQSAEIGKLKGKQEIFQEDQRSAQSYQHSQPKTPPQATSYAQIARQGAESQLARARKQSKHVAII